VQKQQRMDAEPKSSRTHGTKRARAAVVSPIQIEDLEDEAFVKVSRRSNAVRYDVRVHVEVSCRSDAWSLTSPHARMDCGRHC
jgi:hypothetical protein